LNEIFFYQKEKFMEVPKTRKKEQTRGKSFSGRKHKRRYSNFTIMDCEHYQHYRQWSLYRLYQLYRLYRLYRLYQIHDRSGQPLPGDRAEDPYKKKITKFKDLYD
jgi:hypothetical protein